MSEDAGSKLTAIEQRRVMFESGELQKVFLKNMLPPELGATLRAFQDSPAMTLMRNFHESPTGKMLQQIHQSFALFQSSLPKIPQMVLSPDIINAGLVAREFGEALQRMQSPLADYLASGRAPDFGSLVEASGVASASAVATGEARVVTGKELEVDRQIVAHLESGKGVATLSVAQQLHLSRFLNLLRWLVIYLATQNGVREELCHWQPQLIPTMTASQAGKSVRATLCQAGMPLEMLSSYRMVKGQGVNLRTGPGMKAALVQVSLADRALLEVLDGSNRDWLHVAVVSEAGVEGWISRKYTSSLLH